MRKGLLLAIAFFICSNTLLAQALPAWLQQLTALTNAPGVSGFEKGIRQLVTKQWQQAKLKVENDNMGNVFAYVNQATDKPRLLMMAHMDEVGFMVKSITEDGYIRLLPLGGIQDNVLLSQRWIISTDKGPVKAYSGLEAIHIIANENRNQGVKKQDVFLDIGVSSKQQATALGIRPGLAVTPDSQLTHLQGNRYLAKALDDRLGLTAITQVATKLKDKPLAVDVVTAATVQEEVGLRGASTVYASLKPDVVINVEIGIADDFPLLMAERGSQIKLGHGPTLFVYDRSMIPNQGLLNWIAQLAKAHNIPVQYESEEGYGEDGARLQLSGQGVPVINIGIPVRYAHEHAGVFDANDWQQATKLLTLIAQKLDKKTIKQFTA